MNAAFPLNQIMPRMNILKKEVASYDFNIQCCLA